MAEKSHSDESMTEFDVSTASLNRQTEDEAEEKSGVVNLLLHAVVDEQRKTIPGEGEWFKSPMTIISTRY